MLERLLEQPDPNPWREVAIDLAQVQIRRRLPFNRDFEAYLSVCFQAEIREARLVGRVER